MNEENFMYIGPNKMILTRIMFGGLNKMAENVIIITSAYSKVIF